MDTSKLKPFDLEDAKAGKPIVQRNGKPWYFGAYNKNGREGAVVGWDENDDASMRNENGRVWERNDSPLDLFMAPEETTYWVNVYRHGDDLICGVIYMSDLASVCNKEFGGAQYLKTISFTIEE